MDAKSQTDKIKEAAQEKMEDFQEASENIQNRLSEIWENSRDKATEYARTADQKIRDNPYQSIGIAFGVGLLLGLLLTRGGSDED